MLIFDVSCDSRIGKGMGYGARYLAGLAVGALRRRFRELDELRDVGSYVRKSQPSWTASGPSEAHAFRLLGLESKERIPLPPLIQGHGSRGRILIALRGDAAAALGDDVVRIERAIEASIQPTVEAMGLGPVRVEVLRVEHLMSNERTHYRVPSMNVYANWNDGIKDAIRRTIAYSAANMAYGHADRADRLLDISGLCEELVIESFGEPTLLSNAGPQDIFAVSPVRFSIAGRLHGPLFMVDRPGLERPSVAFFDAEATSHFRVAA